MIYTGLFVGRSAHRRHIPAFETGSRSTAKSYERHRDPLRRGADVTSLRALFACLSDRDPTLMKDDMSAPEAVGRWISDPGARFVTLDEDTVVDIVVIVPGVAWSRHVAQLRIVVDPARRRRGIGRALARRDLVEAVSAGRTKLLAEVLADDDAAGVALRRP
jgi:GNAT superfamily N-acetyltransferase